MPPPQLGMLMQAQIPGLGRWRQKDQGFWASQGYPRYGFKWNQNHLGGGWQEKVAQHIKELAIKTDDLSSIPGPHIGKNWFPKVVLWLPFAHSGAQNKYNVIKTKTAKRNLCSKPSNGSFYPRVNPLSPTWPSWTWFTKPSFHLLSQVTWHALCSLSSRHTEVKTRPSLHPCLLEFLVFTYMSA